MKLAEVVLSESVSLAGRETLRLTATEHPSLGSAGNGAVSVRVGASVYIVPSGSIRWLRFVDEEPVGASGAPAAPFTAPSPPVVSQPSPAADPSAASGAPQSSVPVPGPARPAGGKRGGRP
jgi:hypothetical protein